MAWGSVRWDSPSAQAAPSIKNTGAVLRPDLWNGSSGVVQFRLSDFGLPAVPRQIVDVKDALGGVAVHGQAAGR